MDDVTLALTGQLPFVILAAAIAAFPVSLGLLALYRRKVLGYMAQGALPADGKHVPSPVVGTHSPTQVECVLTELDVASTDLSVPGFVEAQARTGRLALLYAAGGSAFTLIMTSAVLVSAEMDMLPVRVALVFAVYAWPVVLTLNLVDSATRSRRRTRVAVYFVILALIAALALARSDTLTPTQVVTLWLITNVPPTILILAFLARRIRAVGPLVVTFMVLCFVGAVLAVELAGANEGLMRVAVTLGSGVGLGAMGILVTIVLSGFVLFAVLGWLVVSSLRRAYEARRMSDQSLALDSMWLLFGILQSIGLAFEGAGWVLSGVAAFLVYKAVVHVGARALALKPTTPGHAPGLLLLRVFSLGKRSEQLFDAITGAWRHLGPVRLIAGPDLAATTVEPHEFLSFLSGRLATLFIDSESTLRARLDKPDPPPDFDGRHRIEDFFCYDDTWEMVLSRLVLRSDAVLMDLRSFAPGNAGCVRELNELMDAVKLDQVVLVVDDSTDRACLQDTLSEAAANMSELSPNRGKRVELRIFPLSDPDSLQVRSLMAHLAAIPARGAA